MKDLVIVGGGPAGCRLAMLLSNSYDVVVVEEHERIGEPIQCAGLVSPRCLDDVTRSSMVCEIRDFVLHSPSGKRLSLHSKEPRGIVIDRAKHDLLLAEAAQARGAEILTGSRADSVKVSGESVRVSVRVGGTCKEIQAQLVVGADGPKSLVRRSMGVGGFDLLYFGAQAIGRLKQDENECAVEMFLGRGIAPDFFVWKIPASETVRIGLCSSKEGTPFELLEKFLRSRFSKFEPSSRQAGLIPVGSLGDLSKGRAILIGDAACQTKPITGGGVYLGKAAAEMLAKAIIAEGPSIAAGELYDRMFRTEFGRELSNAWRLRRVLNEMSDDKLDKAIEIISDEKIRSVLETAGDIDYPANLSTLILRKMPQLLQFFPELVRSGL